MSERLRVKLREAVRKLGTRMTVDQLRRKGVSKVNVVGLDRISALVEAAVRRTLKHKLMGFEGIEAREKIANATRDEFVRLLEFNRELSRARDELKGRETALEAEVDDLRRELIELRKAIEDRERAVTNEERMRAEVVDRGLLGEVKAVIGAQVGGDVSHKIVDLIVHKLETERRRVTDARLHEQQSEVTILEQRIGKLSRLLEQREHELRIEANRHALDTGISSIYREVQGLDTSDLRYAHKKALMTSIFEANLQLKE